MGQSHRRISRSVSQDRAGIRALPQYQDIDAALKIVDDALNKTGKK